MLTCLPIGICSWNYAIAEHGRDMAVIKMPFVGETATIQSTSGIYEVYKPSLMSGEWELIHRGKTIARAAKEGILSQAFDLTADEGRFQLYHTYVLKRGYTLASRGEIVGTIEPTHLFTRRAVIDCPNLPLHLQLFAFCLVVFMWRRNANAAAAPAS